MKRFALRVIIYATLFVLVSPAGSLAAETRPVNPDAGAGSSYRIYLTMMRQKYCIRRYGASPRWHIPDGLRPGA